jgi:hypothetical protein
MLSLNVKEFYLFVRIIFILKHELKKNKLFITLSSLVIYIIITIISILWFFYFSVISFCDSTSLKELKAILVSDIIKYNEANHDYKYWVDLFKEGRNHPESNFDID